MKVGVIGYGVEGQSAGRYWTGLGAAVTVCDAKTDLVLPTGITGQLGADYLANLDQFDLIVRSPGVRPDKLITTKPITSVTIEFMAKCPAPIIGVTGTKGKGTTATLITKILEAAGHKVWLGGNIGTPALDFLAKVKSNHFVVLELSSFQLMDAVKSPQIAVGLMIAEDHTDYHTHMEEYIQAKGNIFRYQTKTDLAVYNAAAPEISRVVELSPGRHLPFNSPEGAFVRDGWVWFKDRRIIQTTEVGLIGRHNLSNVCAAVAATFELINDPAPIKAAIAAFRGLPHRLEEIATINGVRYINDSFAPNPAAAMAAIESFGVPKVVVLGGYNRGSSTLELVEQVATSDVRTAILIGQTAPLLAKQFEAVGFKQYQIGDGSMPAIVRAAQAAAQPGDVVLFSPGAPSFDMFKNFSDRGEQFRAAVANLKERRNYQVFGFESYLFDREAKRLNLNYSLDEVKFSEIYEFDFEFADYDEKALDKAIFGLFMMAGVSYYKAGLPDRVEVKQGSLSSQEAAFFQKTYRLGLGEFSYRNQVPLVEVDFPVNPAKSSDSVQIEGLTGDLVAVGGGKDSIVSVELLHEARHDVTTWMVGASDRMTALIERLDRPHLAIKRTVSAELLRLNEEGAYNGHVPIAGILGFVGVAAAILAGRENVIVSNEWSAGEGNASYQGVEVNHQYSKSFEYELDFQSYLQEFITPSVNYFSLLRPLSELAVAKQFCAHYLDKYTGVFSSCNRNFHLDNPVELHWCGHCPKCAFVFLIFAPFVPKPKLMALFGGKNLFESSELTETYRELLGLTGHKPFECVGEILECRQAVLMAKTTGEYPELEQFSFDDPKFDLETKHASSMPADFAELVAEL